ncbi:hypothetical protein KC992_02495 [Candidatus Saccharibacteria bacterium]|nr:hypothetical protein [Candidatus Saccharibacteria bacterium]
MSNKNTNYRDQAVALSLTLMTCAVLVVLLWGEIHVLNRFTSEDIALKVRWADVLVGMTIYLKTAIDFAIFIGRLMEKNKGLKGRIGIEIGTALGNALGTMAILLVWTFFKEITWLLAIMVFVAGLVLFRLAEDGMEHIDANNPNYPKTFRRFITSFETGLERLNGLFGPLLNRLIPSRSLNIVESPTLKALLIMSFTVPFILGLDDFAGYVPLFNIVNVFGFGIGVFVGHMVLNILLYISPKRTIAAVKNPIISFLGSLAFFGLAIWGIIEAVKLLTGHR